MKQVSCSRCGHPASCGLLLSISTLNQSPRQQVRSHSIPLCLACVNSFLARYRRQEGILSQETADELLKQALTNGNDRFTPYGDPANEVLP